MRVVQQDEWVPGFLDYHRAQGYVRIQVSEWRAADRLADLYFVRPTDPRVVWNYLRVAGVRQVLRKVRSRRAELGRNEKWLSVGLGRIVESDATDLPPGTKALFIAPRHPQCVERIVLPSQLVRAAGPAFSVPDKPSAISYGRVTSAGPALAGIAGWDPESGVTPDPTTLEAAFANAEELLGASVESAAELQVSGEGHVERVPGQRIAKPNSPSVAVFGFGNYAKTIVIPNIERELSVACVHEVDPTQMGPRGNPKWDWDTSPLPRANEEWDVYVAAGFHHTHTPIAVEALSRGADAIVEKPLAVNRPQLAELLAAVRSNTEARLFASFQRRYLPCNRWLREDLQPGPISYNCLVFEEPLPARHWYRWPNSGSRMLSNGCHWIDHFLYLNDFASPREWSVWAVGEHTLSCAILLTNGAEFTMALTDLGSPRIGLRELVEVRSGSTTARIVDGTSYVSEDARRRLRKAHFRKDLAYRRMYASMTSRILSGGSGDSPESIETSAELVLALDESARRQRASDP